MLEASPEAGGYVHVTLHQLSTACIRHLRAWKGPSRESDAYLEIDLALTATRVIRSNWFLIFVYSELANNQNYVLIL